MKNTQTLKQVKNEGGFSLIEVLIGVLFLAFILTALLGGVVFTVNTLAEARFRAQAIDAASSCLDQFRQARNVGWVHFCEHGIQAITCEGATINSVPMRLDSISDNRGEYFVFISGEPACTDDRLRLRVQVSWFRFRDTNDPMDLNEFIYNINRTATVDHTFVRYWDELSVN